MPPTDPNQPGASAPSEPMPQPQPQAPAPVEPKLAPVPPAPTSSGAGLPPSSVPPKKSRVGLIIAIVVVVFLVLPLVAYLGFTTIKSVQKKAATNGTQGSSQSSSAPIVNTCGVKLNEEGRLGADIKTGPFVSIFDSGGDDSILEYCATADLKKAAETYLDLLGAKDWDKAYAMLTAEEKARASQATRVANWKAEFASATFSVATMRLATSGDSPVMSVEPCEREHAQGWGKTIDDGYYTTPQFYPPNDASLRQIDLKLKRVGGTWLIDGENNTNFDIKAELQGDSFAKQQSGRESYNPFQCS